jgi:hypothetical protein
VGLFGIPLAVLVTQRKEVNCLQKINVQGSNITQVTALEPSQQQQQEYFFLIPVTTLLTFCNISVLSLFMISIERVLVTEVKFFI